MGVPQIIMLENILVNSNSDGGFWMVIVLGFFWLDLVVLVVFVGVFF